MTTRLVPLTDAESLEYIAYNEHRYDEIAVDSTLGLDVKLRSQKLYECDKRIEKLQACLKGEAGLDEEEMYDLLQWGDSLVPFTDETNKCASPEIAEKLRSYLGECE